MRICFAVFDRAARCVARAWTVVAPAVLLAVLLGLSGGAFAQDITFPKDDADSSVTVKMQKALYYMGCYKPPFYSSAKVAADGDFGRSTSRSNRALNELRKNSDTSLQTKLKFAGEQDTESSILDLVNYLKDELKRALNANQTTSFCGSLNVPSGWKAADVDKEFGKKAEILANGKVCEASKVSKKYLASLYLGTLSGGLEKVKDLQTPLELASTKFTEIFPSSITSNAEVSTDARLKRLCFAGTLAAVTREDTKKNLDLALANFQDLISRYGANVDPCAFCFAVNDWKLLSSLATGNQGTLFHSSKLSLKVDVAKIKRSWMHDIKDLMLIFRRANSSWLATANGGVGTSQEKIDAANKMRTARNKELDRIITRLAVLEAIEDPKKKVRSRGGSVVTGAGLAPAHITDWDKLMKDVASVRKKSCVGFDGGPVAIK